MIEPNEHLDEEDLGQQIAEFLAGGIIGPRDLGIPYDKLSKSLRYNGRITKGDLHRILGLRREVLEAAVSLGLARERLAFKMEVLRGQLETSAPPLFAELLISLLAPKNTAQAQLGDLQEMFQKNVDHGGLELHRETLPTA